MVSMVSEAGAASSLAPTIAGPGERTVRLVVDGRARDLLTDAPTVASLLTEQDVAVDAHDRVLPRLPTVLTAGATVRVTHLNNWTERVRQPIAPATRRVESAQLAAGKNAVLDPGARGVKQLTYMFTRTADRAKAPQRTLLATTVVQRARPRVVAVGVGTEGELAAFAQRGFDATVRMARRAMTMLATAYTASCGGCSGVTKIGRPAGHGIVAVDPRVIPLGTRLYIPGYGHAIAGDTGGAIVGNRIDLGFASTADAFQFGARRVKVYILQ